MRKAAMPNARGKHPRSKVAGHAGGVIKHLIHVINLTNIPIA